MAFTAAFIKQTRYRTRYLYGYMREAPFESTLGGAQIDVIMFIGPDSSKHERSGTCMMHIASDFTIIY